MKRIRIPAPESRAARLVVGVALLVGGVFWFLPVLGWWMIPAGLVILSRDFPRIRRFERRATVWLGRRLKPKRKQARKR